MVEVEAMGVEVLEGKVEGMEGMEVVEVIGVV